MSVDVLQTKIRKKKCPVAVGMDLRPELIPQAILDRAGEGAAAYGEFGCGVLDALAEVVPAVKFNTAWYDTLGPAGLEVLEDLCAYARKKGYYVILETMRSDAEEAAELYARACFAPRDQGGRYEADALSLGAFLGSDGIRPYLPYCKDQEKSLFLLARTSNKSAREVQDLISGDRVIHQVMTDLAMRWSTDLFAPSGYSKIGVVVGANQPEVLRQMRQRYDRLFFLVPGYGAQGGTAKDVQHAFDKLGHGAVVAASRSILGAWQKTPEADYQESVCAAAVKMRGDIARFVTVI